MKTIPNLIEEWSFPLGGHRATLTIVSEPGGTIEPEDIDALSEISMVFKRQIIKRQQERQQKNAPEYQI